ncbi:MAG TPA: hypothetical protein PK629_07010 [Oscillospiraceae bacterium]|nr:hypothetical protein [Oscillospiraceae bacterium]HPF55469.1 hypothetical protein [Clostridiales bacterium]HPK34303.1 hypothetical protein [Oscillospiraceae bacterium]HPR76924.1 hypothetical protein [Oscillospiraceae bacterium]
MYKSAVGIFLSNIFMTWLVLLNNEGPGWEVPVDTMGKIVLASILIILGYVFAFITLFINLKHIKINFPAFNLFYFINLSLSLAFFVFLTIKEAYLGQFWIQDFNNIIFIIVTLVINIFLITIITLSRYKTHTTTTKRQKIIIL